MPRTLPHGGTCHRSGKRNCAARAPAASAGPTYAELRDTLAAIAGHCDVVGLDLVEVNPTLDVGTGVTSYLAARTVLEFLGNICRQPRWERRREGRAAARN